MVNDAPITKVLYCGCVHADQDRRYGSGNRVHNQRQSKGRPTGTYRCTVCKKERGK